MSKRNMSNTNGVSEYRSMMELYIYDMDTVQNLTDSHMQTIKDLATQLLNNEQLWSEINKLSAKQSPCVWRFAHSLGFADTNAVLLPHVLGAQDRTQPIMPDFQRGYITGMLQNSIKNAISNMHDVVTSGEQKLHCFSWYSLGTKLEDVPKDSLKKLIRALLMCNSRSRITALELCARYYDKSNNVPRYVSDMLLDVHSDVFASTLVGAFEYWKGLLIKSMEGRHPSTQFISELLQIALRYEPEHFVDGGWSAILTTMLNQNKKGTWRSILRLIEKPKNTIKIKYLLNNRTGVLDDSVALEVIQKWTNSDLKHRSVIMASVLPNDLDTITKWMSLYHKKNKAAVASMLISNLLTDSFVGSHEEHYRQKIGEVETAKKNTNDAVVLNLLKGYEAELLVKLGRVLHFQMSDAFGMGKTESAEEKKDRDSLRHWLGKRKDIKNMHAFLDKFNDEMDGSRRLDGNVWHGELIKLFCEDGTFPVIWVEYKRKINGKTVDVDIKLTDTTNPKEQVNIQAWEGMSETGHKIRRMLNTGIPHNMDDFNWSSEHETLDYKIGQLPKRGQNFVINKSSDTALTLMSSHKLLTDHVCVMQIRDLYVNVHHLSSFKYKETARKIVKILGLKPNFFEDDWSGGPDGMNNLLAASYGFDPHKVYEDGSIDIG